MVRAGIELPAEIAQRVRDIEEGRTQPAEPRQSATVVLLRGAADGIGVQVYMLRRAATMAFAAGMQAFPGGSVDPRDADGDVGWAGPSPEAWGRAFGVPPDLAHALVCAAVRETFEESGVLLAGPEPATVVEDTRGEDWEADRQALLDHSVSLAQVLHRRGLVLRSDLLGGWAQWITPTIEPRRYDTKFFVAALPAGQRTRDVGGEADQVAWWEPVDALDGARRGDIALLPPTAVTLAELGVYENVAEVLAAAPQREILPRLPTIELVDGQARLIVPDGVEYPL